MEKKVISLSNMIGKPVTVEHDSNYVYVTQNNEIVHAPLEDIVALEKTHTALNNRYFWKLDYRVDGATNSVTFRTNTTFWNRNFRRFVDLLKQTNPACVKTQLRWWNF